MPDASQKLENKSGSPLEKKRAQIEFYAQHPHVARLIFTVLGREGELISALETLINQRVSSIERNAPDFETSPDAVRKFELAYQRANKERRKEQLDQHLVNMMRTLADQVTQKSATIDYLWQKRRDLYGLMKRIEGRSDPAELNGPIASRELVSVRDPENLGAVLNLLQKNLNSKSLQLNLPGGDLASLVFEIQRSRQPVKIPFLNNSYLFLTITPENKNQKFWLGLDIEDDPEQTLIKALIERQQQADEEAAELKRLASIDDYKYHLSSAQIEKTILKTLKNSASKSAVESLIIPIINTADGFDRFDVALSELVKAGLLIHDDRFPNYYYPASAEKYLISVVKQADGYSVQVKLDGSEVTHWKQLIELKRQADQAKAEADEAAKRESTLQDIDKLVQAMLASGQKITELALLDQLKQNVQYRSPFIAKFLNQLIAERLLAMCPKFKPNELIHFTNGEQGFIRNRLMYKILIHDWDESGRLQYKVVSIEKQLVATNASPADKPAESR